MWQFSWIVFVKKVNYEGESRTYACNTKKGAEDRRDAIVAAAELIGDEITVHVGPLQKVTFVK